MQSVDQISQISPIQTHYGRRVASNDFAVPESPLRSRQIARVASVYENDPAADSVELSRDYPQLLVGQTYSPPPAQAQKVAGLQDESTSGSAMDDGEESSVGGTEGENEQAAEAEGEDENNVRLPGQETDAKGQPLSEGELGQLRELKSRDQEVRTHEQAHKAVGGMYAGGVSYEYQQGPDGNRYAVGGEVSIDVSAEREPAATIAKMRQVRAAAMAPANPSPQDRSVASQASQTEGQARKQLLEQQTTEAAGESDQSGQSEEKTQEAGESANASGAGGGNASLSSNPYVNAFESSRAETAYSTSASRNADRLAMSSGYTPINVVA